MSRLTYNRRVALGMLAIGALPAVYGAYAVIAGTVRCAATKWDGEVLAVIGRSYLAIHPEEASMPRLMAQLERSSAEVAAALRGGAFEDALEAARGELARPDAELVQCDGWLFGRAEARCAALVALAQDATVIELA